MAFRLNSDLSRNGFDGKKQIQYSGIIKLGVIKQNRSCFTHCLVFWCSVESRLCVSYITLEMAALQSEEFSVFCLFVLQRFSVILLTVV